ncbi:hypothetical protein RKE25_01435 [Dyella sp. BiH032]|uniref:hypothetical protein n=1 Tax=Dyella sp. BiH032 TaxID=3075430 RepID=UPI0028934A3C|nr:hypothetical protein [Dyella sp. BiH032]WNL46326.1 hypothetical protein RKE25_01435 [Dyella sp. BiH032]
MAIPVESRVAIDPGRFDMMGFNDRDLPRAYHPMVRIYVSGRGTELPHSSQGVFAMRYLAVSASICFSVLASAFSGQASAEYDCNACMRNYLSCLSQGPGNPAQQAICDHEYAGCLAQCDGLGAAQPKKPFKHEDGYQLNRGVAQTMSWVDHGT